jgi:hypothetical protein
LPVVRFSIRKSVPGRDSLDAILRQRAAEDAAPPTHAEFGLRYSLQASSAGTAPIDRAT